MISGIYRLDTSDRLEQYSTATAFKVSHSRDSPRCLPEVLKKFMCVANEDILSLLHVKDITKRITPPQVGDLEASSSNKLNHARALEDFLKSGPECGGCGFQPMLFHHRGTDLKYCSESIPTSISRGSSRISMSHSSANRA